MSKAKQNACEKINFCTNVGDYLRSDGWETHNSDSTPDHLNSDGEDNVQNDVNAKCLHAREIPKQPKHFDC